MLKIFCKHQWELLSETYTTSKLEHATSLGGALRSFNSSLLERKFIQILTCQKCGKHVRYVEDI